MIFQKKSPHIKNIHEFHLYEWCPFQICIDMHLVLINDKFEMSDTVLIRDITLKIKEYFSSKFYVHQITIQPEILEVSYFWSIVI